MTRKQLEELQHKLEYYCEEPLVIGKFTFEDGEGDRYAAQIESDFETYLTDEYDTEESVIESIKELFDEVDDASWMFDDEENDERNEAW